MTMQTAPTTDVYAIHNALEAASAGIGGDLARQALRARLDLFEESVVLTRYSDSQPTSVYEVDPTALAQAFAGLPLLTGLLPRDCLFYEVAGGQERMAIYVAGHTYPLRVHTATIDATWLVPLPGMIWLGQGIEYKLLAVKQRPGAASERLFRAPAPNVWHDGRVCNGDVNFPVCNAATIHQAFRLFVGSTFNADLNSGKAQSYEKNILDQWRALAEAEVSAYPLDELVKTETKLEDIMRRPK